MNTNVMLLVVLWVLPVCGEDVDAARALGPALLRALPAVSAGFSHIMYYEIVRGDETIGYGRLLVEAEELNTGRGYAYGHDAFIQMPDGGNIKARLSATLNRQFSPIRVTGERTVSGPEGPRVRSKESAMVGSNGINVTKTVDGDKQSQEYPLPAGPFVFGIDFLLQRLDLNEGPYFVLKELDFQEGKAISQHFKLRRDPDGTTHVDVIMGGNPQRKRLLVLSIRQELISFADPPNPVVKKRVDKARFDELKKTMNPRDG